MSPGSTTKEPLAYRMAPRTLAEFFGQRHILAPEKLLYRMIEADQLSSIILFGPPGSGKSSLARLIAKRTEKAFRRLNAVTSGVADIKRIIEETDNYFLNPSGRCLLFIDEIHRFNKTQQDALLPRVEDGTLTLIGATTENPYFEVNKALLSRSTVFQLQALDSESIKSIIRSALQDSERGLGAIPIDLNADALELLSIRAQGDARIALNTLELAVSTTIPNADGRIEITTETLSESLDSRRPHYDKSGEQHYDVISAFIKSMRGSDPDATVYYLARMLEAGEDIEFIARRILVAASEDVGLANPQILSIAVSAYQAVTVLGMPEARIILSEAALAVATSPKSNTAYLAIDRALEEVRKGSLADVPLHLRNAPVKAMRDLGYQVGYLYPHDYPLHYVNQQYLPDKLKEERFFQACDQGYEKKIAEYLQNINQIKEKSGN